MTTYENKFDDEILKLHSQHIGSASIAKRLKVSRFHVMDRLRAHGRLKQQETKSIWSLDEDERREEFRRRAAAGARAALEGKEPT